MSKTFFLLAGEISGDKLGAELIGALDTLYPEAAFLGMGGPKMSALGLNTTEDMSQLSIMGIGEVISSYRKLQALADRLVARVIASKPDAIFTIDSKAFSVRFAKKLKAEMQRVNYHAPIIHMVAPTIWAWGAWRRKAFETNFDGLLCLFPFEPDLFDANKIDTAFIGHPVGYDNRPDITNRDPNVIGLLPGSRRSEIRYILLDMLEAASKISKDNSKMRYILPALPHLQAEIQAHISKFDLPIEVLSDGDAMKIVQTTASLCMAASGTVTLELALSAMPTVTCYKTSTLNYLFMRGLFKLKDPILPHILLQETIFPYFEQNQQNATNLAQSVLSVRAAMGSEMQNLKIASDRLRAVLTDGKSSFQVQLQSILQSQLNF